MRRTAGALMGVMLMAGTGSAQTTDSSGYVAGFAGLARVNQTTSGLFGGEAGFAVTETLEVFGNVGYALNIFPDAEREVLVDGCAPIVCDAKARMTFFTGGARYSFKAGTALRPYVAAGVGAAHVSITVEADGEDISEDVEDIVGDLTSTNGLFEVGGGIDLPVGANGKIDIGYRLMKLFEEDSDAAHRFYAGFGWKF
jgi:opacity protein-like surface antigen